MKEILKYIFVLAAGQSVIIAYLLSSKKESPVANKFLIFGNIIFACDLLMLVLYIEKFYLSFPFLIGINLAFPFVYGPEVYLYTKAIRNNSKKVVLTDLLHFLPFVFLTIIHTVNLITTPSEFFLGVIEGTLDHPFFYTIVGYTIPFHGVFYMFLTFKNLNHINYKLKTSYSIIDDFEKKWMHIIVYGSAAVWVSVIIAYSLNMMVVQDFWGDVIIYSSLSVFVFILSYNSYKQTQRQIQGDEPEKTDESYKKSTLSEESAQQYISQLLELLENEKLYTTNNLSLRNLSDKLGISTHLLSEIINTKLNKNFYDLINGYRIEEVKRLIEEDKDAKFNIIALAYDAGFSSKTTFNNLFKKYTNLTPSEYRAVLKAK
ncbi:MAG: AraC family transcriptional regulator [Ignavibacteria bacterium]|nr:AraC family transcriptional regulator [Ignavibacteria bacterium]